MATDSGIAQSSSNRSVAELVEEIKQLTDEIQQLYRQDDLPWIIGYSGGKDSTAIFQLVWNAIAALSEDERKKTIHVITTDTMVENPVVSAWVVKSLDRMKVAAEKQKMPVNPLLLKPAVRDTFWVNLIGKGYPAPRQGFRWCTERLKIKPSDNYIREMIRSSGEVILVLGTRKAESASRAKLMAKHRNWRVFPHINYNPNRPNSLIYTPIEDWTTDEVWLYLMQWKNPWGNNNKDLFTMYRGATADNECPLVIDTSTPSCGSSRFGCWVCTLVDRDKSMEAMISNDEEKEWMQPLLDLRNELDVENDLDRRDFRRRQGHVQLYERQKDKSAQTEVVNIPGPYKKKWREEWVRRVLQAQAEARQNAPADMKDIELIAIEELSEIRRIWIEEFHEFDDSLPRIYQETTGKIFIDPRPNAGNSELGSDEWEILEDLCDDPMELELMVRLLDTERQFQTMSRRVGVLDALEKCFDTSSRSQNEAMESAKAIRQIKQAAKDGDIEVVKSIINDEPQSGSSYENENSWASAKFGI
ncbi:DNA phosphorothioation system sulfurtransferase DndC [Nodosilinea sp. FACHB-131]|uniref:DNA phosphorothioation system sulfurtransferase DndC n=1 Tax=Cyanophyceae TaxID=3028117 RepID=UPI0016877862|nr:DNA phosphorothioation system sulfurtransferase DndC [Nodosilinea sp. FACHB-131]